MTGFVLFGVFLGLCAALTPKDTRPVVRESPVRLFGDRAIIVALRGRQ